MQLSTQDIYDGINTVRANPNSIVLRIKEQLNKFESNTVYRNRQGIKVRTMSGKAAWQDSILSLQRQKPKDDLFWNNDLAQAAENYKSMSQANRNNPNFKANPFDIIKSMCSYQGMISFNVNESQVEGDIIELIASMIVCDGNQEKGTRTAIFHPKYRQFGCAISYEANKMYIYMIFCEKVNKGASKASNSKGNTYNALNKEQRQIKGGQSYHQEQQDKNTRQYYLKAGKQLIAQLNKIRKDPKGFIIPLKQQMSKFKDQRILVTDYGTVNTKQGKIPYQDLISQLQSQYPLPTIRQIQGLTYTALQQLLQIESKVERPTQADILLNKFCVSSEGIRSIKLTNVAQMPINAMLLRLLIGDGDRKRTGRRKLLSPICKAIGCAISREALIVNVGQSAKDNQETVDNYTESLQHVKQQQNKNSPYKKQKNLGQNNNKIDPYPSFGSSNHKKQVPSFNSFEGSKVVVKRIQKSQTRFQGDRKYKVTIIHLLFDDGTEQETIQEDLIS